MISSSISFRLVKFRVISFDDFVLHTLKLTRISVYSVLVYLEMNRVISLVPNTGMYRKLSSTHTRPESSNYTETKTIKTTEENL